MDTELLISLISLIIFFILFCIGFYKLGIQEYIAIRKHTYLTPPTLRNNAQWQSLLEDWRSLTKLKSWRPEYSRAEEAYRLKSRKFFKTDLDQPNILDVPVVAVALQCTEVYIERYHTSTGDLDWKKSLSDSRNMINVIFSDDLPDKIKSTVRKIRDTTDLVDDDGVDAAKEQLDKIKTKLDANKLPITE